MDIAKCFDQIIRELVYALAAKAGMPPQVLDAYRRFQEALTIHNTVAGGIGRGFQRRCGIPQGCPLSMAMTALIMRPWVLMAKQNGASPRILADAIMIVTSGTGMVRKFAKSLTFTHQYLIDMGAKIAEGKSMNFASNSNVREWLATTAWPLAGGSIIVVDHLRYLGGHISTTTNSHADTLRASCPQAAL